MHGFYLAVLAPKSCNRTGWPVREIINAIFSILRGGISWRMLPDCFPPEQMVYDWFLAFPQTASHHDSGLEPVASLAG